MAAQIHASFVLSQNPYHNTHMKKKSETYVLARRLRVYSKVCLGHAYTMPPALCMYLVLEETP